MLRNYLTIIFRRLRKERVYTFVNIFGLTIGLTVFLLIGLYVRDELSFDRFHKDLDHIYRITEYDTTRGTQIGVVPSDFVEYVAEDIPQVNSYVRIQSGGTRNLIASDESKFYAEGLIFTDQNFFSFFDFELLDGNKDFVLSQARSIVLTESFALKLFGTGDVVGEEMVIDKKDKFIISGICKDPPKNSTIQFELVALADKNRFEVDFEQNGFFSNVSSFLKIPESTNISLTENLINDHTRKKPAYFAVMRDVFFELSPLVKQRLFTDFRLDSLNINDAKYVYIFSGIGLVVLLLAMINYVNLVTAQSIKRTKEVGLRKVIGARRKQLIQFQLLESIVITLLAVIMSFAMAERLVPQFNQVLEKQVMLNYFSLDFFVWILVLGGLLGLLAGIYPSYYISRIDPLALMGKSSSKRQRRGLFRKTLVLFQFVTSGILILVLTIMSNQMNFLNQKKLGFEEDYLLSIPIFRDPNVTPKALKSALAQVNGVQKVSHSTWRFGGGISTGRYDRIPREGEEFKESWSDLVLADEGFVETMGLKVLAASAEFDPRNLLEDQVIVNESLLKSFGWPRESLGKQVYEHRGTSKRIVAIVEDFHSYSMKEEIKSLVIEKYRPWASGNILLQVNANGMDGMLEELTEVYESITDRPIDYYFLDDRIDSYYKKERGQFQLFQLFSALAVFISFLGLIALTIYMVEQRRKEVSIRKVLGASLKSLIMMLNREYTGLVILAFLIASPIAFFAMQDWLLEFKYRVGVSPLLFVGACSGFLVLSWIVTIFQSVRVSKENPADVLREE